MEYLYNIYGFSGNTVVEKIANSHPAESTKNGCDAGRLGWKQRHDNNGSSSGK